VTATEPVNRWTDAGHALDYLESRDRIPHRTEGYTVLLELLAAPPRRVLDLGTGDGLLLALVRAAWPDVEGVGVDFSATMLTAAHDRFAGTAGVTLVEHDLDSPLPDLGAFDAVVSAFAIHHLVDARTRALAGEVFACLEPGGVFANLEHVDSPTVGLHDAFLAALGRTPADDDPSNQLVSVEAQLGYLRDAGFVDVDCLWKWRELALLVGVKPG
jgi:tRNA (cmo5U34)-methyltransferase